MTIRWFSDEDRQRMREEREEQKAWAERDALFFKFLREEHPDGIGIGRAVMPEFIEIGRLDNRPWLDRPDAQGRPAD